VLSLLALKGIGITNPQTEISANISSGQSAACADMLISIYLLFNMCRQYVFAACKKNQTTCYHQLVTLTHLLFFNQIISVYITNFRSRSNLRQAIGVEQLAHCESKKQCC